MATSEKLKNQTKVFLHWLAVSRLDQRAKNKQEQALTEILKASGEVPTKEVIALHNAFICGMNSR